VDQHKPCCQTSFVEFARTCQNASNEPGVSSLVNRRSSGVPSKTRVLVRLLPASSLTRSLCAAACCVLLELPAEASASRKPLTEYTHTVWTHKDGIPSAFIYSIAQTQDGYLWLATTDGLVRFDGVRFVHWRPRTGNRELLGVVRSLCAARDGGLWIGTAAGLVGHTRGDDLTTVSVGRQVEAMLEDRDGTLWVATGNHLFRFRKRLSVPRPTWQYPAARWMRGHSCLPSCFSSRARSLCWVPAAIRSMRGSPAGK